MKRSILFAVSTLFLQAPLWAQGFVASPINIKAKKLTPYFLGHSPSTIYPALDAKKTVQGRFETSAQYAARRARVTSTPLFGQVYLWSPLGFCIPPSWCDYNADTGEFTAHFALYKATKYDFNGGDFSSTSSVDYLRTLTQSYQDYSRSYRAQNAFGAETTVYAEGTTNFGVGIMNWKDFRFVATESSGEKMRMSYKTTLPPSSAQRLEKDIRLLLVGYSTTPYQIEDYGGRTATYTSPFSESHKYNFVTLRLKEAWFYDITSGYIFGKTIPTKFGATKPVFAADASGSSKAITKTSVPRNADGSLKTNENCCAGIKKTVSSYFLSASQKGVVTDAQARALSDTNLRLAVNEMFARYGLTFKDPKLQAYFCARTWYHPNVNQSGAAIFEEMSEAEKGNLKVLSDERARRKVE